MRATPDEELVALATEDLSGLPPEALAASTRNLAEQLLAERGERPRAHHVFSLKSLAILAAREAGDEVPVGTPIRAWVEDGGEYVHLLVEGPAGVTPSRPYYLTAPGGYVEHTLYTEHRTVEGP